ncbi:MAG: xanthine dehydrogenase family protein molybdopterin-binding subunit [Pedobacter sp.]|nr:MAG: xanthine dehydrogenase family protein molybdopterin-binding subunit [Pedobacter sp.]
MQKSVGQPINRLEGKLKVTGAAKYAAEYDVKDVVTGYVLSSPVTKGKILEMDTSDALALTGVIDVITHQNRPKLAWFDIQYTDMDAPPGTVFKPLYNEKIMFNGQPIALVLAHDLETARYATTLIKVKYEQEAFDTCLENNLDQGRNAKKGFATLLKPPPPKPTGDFLNAYEQAPIKTSTSYHHSAEHHNPIELFATTTVYEGNGKLTIYDKTQGTINNQLYVANIFGLRYKDVRVLAPFVGGGFGSGLRPQYQLFLCVMAAMHLKRNVKLTLDRKQMFTFGHRPETLQNLRFATDINGKITALNHSAFAETSQFEDYTDPLVAWSHKVYPSANTLFDQKVVPLDVFTPIDMRAPGGCSAMHAIECTMDELAYKLKMDPLTLRLINYSEVDDSSKKPYTSKALKACYLQAAEKFGWDKRNPEPGSMTKGNKLVGYGMATGIWDAYQFPSRVEAMIDKDGKFILNNAVTDIGTGTLTVMTQIAADELGLSMKDVDFRYGDSKKPFSMFQGGSAMTSSTGSAIVVAAKELKVEIDKDLKTITVTRAVTAVAAGKIINPKTAKSQILGSMVWGISKALHEESIMDENLGKYINTNLGEYHIPVHADINDLEVIFAEENDELINELGVKGVGEIGLVAVPAAIANAIFHATGKRVNNLPIHFDELL